MSIQRVRCLWQAWPGSPGYTNLYTTIAVASVAPINTFWDSVKAFLPSGLTVQTPGSGDIINETTGQIQGVWTAAGSGTITGTGSGTYAGPAGSVVEWLTSGIVAGRRVMGKSYLVPMIASSFETNGTVATATLAAIQAAASALQTALGSTLVVWSRPFEPNPNAIPPDTRPARVGTSWPVIGARVPDLAVVMKSRRT